MKVLDGEPELQVDESSSVAVPDYEAADLERITGRTNCCTWSCRSHNVLGFIVVVVKLAKRFEKTDDGYVGFVTLVDRRSMALKILLLGADEEWTVDLAVNSVVRMCGSVEKTSKLGMSSTQLFILFCR